MECLFCGDFETNYKPDPGTDFICSTCVQLFLGADQKELKTAYKKAIDKRFTDKARAIESFIVGGGNNGPKRINTRKFSYLKRGDRVLRGNKTSLSTVGVKKRTSKRKNNKQHKAVFGL